MTEYAVAFSPEAQEQLAAIEDYLAHRFYPENAKRFVQRLTQACLTLALAPHQGTKRDDLGAGIRTTGFEHRATIYFKVAERKVLIVGVLYGGRTFAPES